MEFVCDRHVIVTKDGRELTVHRFIVKMSAIADPMALVLGQTTANVV
jgi:hypothetical protein